MEKANLDKPEVQPSVRDWISGSSPWAKRGGSTTPIHSSRCKRLEGWHQILQSRSRDHADLAPQQRTPNKPSRRRIPKLVLRINTMTTVLGRRKLPPKRQTLTYFRDLHAIQ